MNAVAQPFGATRRASALARVRWAPAFALTFAFGLRELLVWDHVSPDYLPDEYQYAAIARSLASSLRPDVRGQSSHLAALLAPILTAPAWIAGSVATDFRVAQAIGALAMTLTAVPVYLLARRVGLTPMLAYAAAAFTLVIPDNILAGDLLSEPFAYPLVLAACLAGSVALARPSRRSQLAFVAFAALATLARTELAVVPVAFVVAAVVFGLCDRSLAGALRAQRLPLGLTFLGAGIAAVAVLSRGLGYYAGAVRVGVHAGALATSAGENTLTLMYACGWILVPGAILGTVLALARPRRRVERAFGAMTVAMGLALLSEASIFGSGWGAGSMVEERYTFYALPLVAISFGLYASRGLPHRRLHALLALGLLLPAVLVPLSGLAAPGLVAGSPFLWGVTQLEVSSGGVVHGAEIVLVAATLLALVAAVAPWFGRRAAVLLIALGLMASGAAYAGAWVFDRSDSVNVLQLSMPRDASWIDDAHLGAVTLIAAPGVNSYAVEQLFWNRSIDRVGLLPKAQPPDGMATEALRVGRDGVLRVNGRPLRGPVAVESEQSTLVLAAARRIASAPQTTLWDPAGVVRLRLAFEGRGSNGALAPAGRITMWSQGSALAGRLRFTLRPLPGYAIHFWVDGVPVRGDHVDLSVCASQRWTVNYSVHSAAGIDAVLGVLIAGSATAPAYTPDPGACPAPSRP